MPTDPAPLISAIVFDFDGLLMDTETTSLQSWEYEWRQWGLTLDRTGFFADHGGSVAEDRYARLAAAVGAGFDRELSHRRRTRYREQLHTRLDLRPGIADWIEQATDRGTRVAVASSSETAWVIGHLERIGLLERFAVIAGGEEVTGHKPDPAVYQLALRRLGITARDAVAVEDTPHGVTAAHRAGLRCIAIPNPYVDRGRVAHAELVLGSAAELDCGTALERVAGSERLTAEMLTDGRLSLEPLAVEHAEEMAASLADPQLYLFTGGSPPTAADLRERYTRQAIGRSPDRTQWWLNWVIRLQADPDRPAVGYVQATVTADRTTAELAWVVGVPWQGRGIAARAVRLVAARLAAARLIAHIHPDHAASEAIARRLGMAPTDEVQDGERLWSTHEGLLAADPRIEVLDSILDETRRLVSDLRPEQHAAPTPCEDFDVRRLLEHLIGWQQVATACLAGQERPFGEGSPTYRLPTDRAVDATTETAADLHRSAADLIAGITRQREPAVDYPYRGHTPVTLLLDEFVAETLLHTWDLATAVGSPVHFRPGEIAAADRGLAALLQESFAPTGFKAARDSEGSDLEALLARSGRNPDRRPHH